MPEIPGGRYGDEPSPEDRLAGRARWTRPAAEGRESHVDPEVDPDPVNVYLSDANLDRRVNCIIGIRAILTVLAGGGSLPTDRAPLEQAEARFEAFLHGQRPTFIGYADDRETAKEAAEAGLKASNGNIAVGYNLTAADIAEAREEHAEAVEEPPTPEAEQPEPFRLITPDGMPDEDFDPSAEAAKCALNLLAMTKADATLALFWARVLRANSGDELWDEVAALIAGSFPVMFGSDA